MHSFSLVGKESSCKSSTLHRFTVARNASTMNEGISCDDCNKMTVVSDTRRTSFRLSFEATIVTILVFLASIVSISRTSTLLSNVDARYGLRSLQIINMIASTDSLLLPVDRNQPRVVYLKDHPGWILPTKDQPIFKMQMGKSYSAFNEKQNEDSDDDVYTDPTRQYDQNDSADLPTLERPRWPSHDFDPHCQPAASWQSTFHPTCNEIHSGVDLKQAMVDDEISLLSNKGYWRHAWLHGKAKSYISIPSVWKTLKFAHHFEEKYYEDTRVDAVAMERLTASPYVIDIYGFCGLTVVQEYGGKDLTRALAGGKMTSRNKLKLAKQIAEGVHHIHSIRDDDGDIYESKSVRRKQQQVTLVHNDINLANLLFTVDNRPMLNDFNIAKLGMRHNITGEMCSFYSHFPNPQWKSPEEQVLYDKGNVIESRTLPIVNDKVDIYALGNVYYRILTGLNPWRRPDADRLYDADKAYVARMKKFHGATPPISDELIHHVQADPALNAILNVMNLCFHFHPDERPTASKIVQMLSNTLEGLI